MSTFPDSDAVTVCAPDIITYRLKGKMVYVTPALNYEEAIANAREVFPELVGVDERRITFSVSVKLNNSEKDTAVIGPMAWGSLVQRLRLYEVVNIEISQPQAERGAAPMSQFGARLRAFVCGGKSSSGSQSAEGKSMGEGHSRWDDSESKTHRVSKV